MYMYWALQVQIHTLQLCTADWFFLVYKSHTLKALLTLVFTNTRWSFFGRVSFSFTTAKLHQFRQKTKKYSNYQVFIKFVFHETYLNMYTYRNQFFNCISIQLSKNQMSISEIHIMTNYMEKYPGKNPHIQLFFCLKRCKTEINKTHGKSISTP